MAEALENVRVFTGKRLSEPTRVVIDGGSLAAGNASTEIAMDAGGATLLPGLIDTHIHVVQGRDDLESLAHWGVTTGLDMAAWPVQFVDAMRSEKGVAQIFSPTTPAVGSGGNHAKMPGFPADGIVTSPEAGRVFVENRVRDGADYIKIVTEAEPPEGMDQETVDAIVAAAHEKGLKVVAHSVTTGAFHVAITAGVDISTHAPLDDVLDADSIASMHRAGMVSSPTLTMMKGTADYYAASGRRYEFARDTVAAFYTEGIPILAGTDANSAPGAPFAPAHGSSLHDELELLVEAGLSPIEALAGATSLAAEVFDLEDRGAIAEGRRADLVLVDGDPTTDISTTRNILAVWIEGERIR